MHWDHYWPSKRASVLGTRLGLFRFFQAGEKSQSSYVHSDSICWFGTKCRRTPRRAAHQRSSSLSRDTGRNRRTTMALMAFCTGPGIRCTGWAIVVFGFVSSCVGPRAAITFIVRRRLKAEKNEPPCPHGEQPNPLPFVTMRTTARGFPINRPDSVSARCGVSSWPLSYNGSRRFTVSSRISSESVDTSCSVPARSLTGMR